MVPHAARTTRGNIFSVLRTDIEFAPAHVRDACLSSSAAPTAVMPEMPRKIIAALTPRVVFAQDGLASEILLLNGVAAVIMWCYLQYQYNFCHGRLH